MASGTVLVVDDDRQLAATVREALQEEGYDVLLVHGEEAVELARVWRPGLILLNLALPGADGAELGSRLRAEPTTARIPIVAMSGHAELERAAGRMPADARLAKPFGLEELEAAVARCPCPSPITHPDP